jgi:hypothetical protein
MKRIVVEGFNNSGSFSGSGLAVSTIFPKGMHYITNIPPAGQTESIVTITGYYAQAPLASWFDITTLPQTVATPKYIVDTAVATANYTVTSATYITLPDLTGQANRNFVLPAAPSGYVVVVRNTNTSAFHWTFTGGTVKDLAGNSITQLADPQIYELTFNGTNWDITN